MRLGDSTHDAALARTTDSNSKSVARDRPIDSAPQGVLTWRLRGTLPVIGKTRSRCDQSTLEIATSPSGLDAPDRRDFPKIRIDAVRRRDVPFGLTSEVDSPMQPPVPMMHLSLLQDPNGQPRAEGTRLATGVKGRAGIEFPSQRGEGKESDRKAGNNGANRG